MTSQAPAVIHVDHLGKTFGDVVAVQDVSFSVGPGEVLGLLGPNGAGKTTVVKMLTTLTAIDRGSAVIAGNDVTSRPEAVRRVIGLAGQSAAVDEMLTARENLELFGRLYKLPRSTRRRRIDELIERFDMTEFADRPASTYSGGQRRRLDIVAALVDQPQALFLDEPTTGLDPRSRAEVWDSVRALATEGTAILLTTQYLDEADRLADEILILDQGRTVATGSSEDLKRDAGRNILAVHFAADDDLAIARTTISDGEVVSGNGRQIDIPITFGAPQSLEILRSLEDRGVTITNFEFRRPTLDDVFLALTGSRPTDSEVAAP